MAYFIYNKNEPDMTDIYKIAEDDNALANLNITEDHIRLTVSDEEFNYVKQEVKYPAAYDGSNFTWEDLTQEITKENLDHIIQSKIRRIEDFLNAPNSGHPDYNFWNTYKDTLSNFDTSTITYPMAISWDKYCEDNGIAYKSILQLP